MQILKNIKLPDFDILAQPDDTTCGPTCLHAIYQYFNDQTTLKNIIEETATFSEGGTLAVVLGNHALKRGYKASIYTYNLMVFDPTWFEHDSKTLTKLLIEQNDAKRNAKLSFATKAYVDFLTNGGEVKFEDLTKELIVRYLDRGIPVLTGLSATYLYSTPREIPETNSYDDVKGEPSGHFIVISGYDDKNGKFLIADPLKPNPMAEANQMYSIEAGRLINAIMLGIVTYDSNLLIIEPNS